MSPPELASGSCALSGASGGEEKGSFRVRSVIFGNCDECGRDGIDVCKYATAEERNGEGQIGIEVIVCIASQVGSKLTTWWRCRDAALGKCRIRRQGFRISSHVFHLHLQPCSDLISFANEKGIILPTKQPT